MHKNPHFKQNLKENHFSGSRVHHVKEKSKKSSALPIKFTAEPVTIHYFASGVLFCGIGFHSKLSFLVETENDEPHWRKRHKWLLCSLSSQRLPACQRIGRRRTENHEESLCDWLHLVPNKCTLSMLSSTLALRTSIVFIKPNQNESSLSFHTSFFIFSVSLLISLGIDHSARNQQRQNQVPEAWELRNSFLEAPAAFQKVPVECRGHLLLFQRVQPSSLIQEGPFTFSLSTIDPLWPPSLFLCSAIQDNREHQEQEARSHQERSQNALQKSRKKSQIDLSRVRKPLNKKSGIFKNEKLAGVLNGIPRVSLCFFPFILKVRRPWTISQ